MINVGKLYVKFLGRLLVQFFAGRTINKSACNRTQIYSKVSLKTKGFKEVQRSSLIVNGKRVIVWYFFPFMNLYLTTYILIDR